MPSPVRAATGLVLDPDVLVLHRADGSVQLGWGPDTAAVVVPPDGMDAFDVRALLVHRGHDAEHDVVHPRGVQVVALGERGEHARGEGDGLDAVQGALLALAAWGAHGVVDERLGSAGRT